MSEDFLTSALGSYGTELEDPSENVIIGAISDEIEYRIRVSMSGPSTTVAGKVPDWLITLVSLVCENRNLPWSTHTQVMRDALYYFVRGVKHQELNGDPRWIRAMAKADVEAWLDDAKERQDALFAGAKTLRKLLLLHLAAGDFEKAQNALCAFWSRVEKLPDEERSGYERLFHTMPVVTYVAASCKDRLPEQLWPSKEEWGKVAEADLTTEEGLPAESDSTTPPLSLDAIRERNAKYMREYRKGVRRRKKLESEG